MIITKELYKGIYRIPSTRRRNWNYANDGKYFITIVTAGRRQLFGEIKDGKMYLNPYGQIAYNEFFKSFEIRKELFLGEFVIMPNHIHAIVHIDNEKNENSPVETHGRTSQNVCASQNNVSNVETHGRTSLQNDTTVETDGFPNVETHGRASQNVCASQNNVSNVETYGRTSLQNDATVETDGLPNVETYGRASQNVCASQNVRTSLQPEHWSLIHSIDHSVCFREPKSLSSFVGDFKSATLSRIDDWIDENGIDSSYKYNRNKPLWQQRFWDRIIRDGKEYQNIANYIKKNPQMWSEDSINPINSMELDVPDNLFM